MKIRGKGKDNPSGYPRKGGVGIGILLFIEILREKLSNKEIKELEARANRGQA